MNAHLVSTSHQRAETASQPHSAASTSEPDPWLMIAGVGATALTMSAFVGWNAAAAPALLTQLAIGSVAVITLVLARFIFSQRSSRYARHGRAQGRSTTAVDAKAHTTATRSVTVRPSRRSRPAGSRARAAGTPLDRQHRVRVAAHG